MRVLAVIFDLDGTLLDSDAALVQPFLELGVAPEEISFGHPIELECARLGISLDSYVSAYDTSVVRAFAGVEEMLSQLDRWAVCSNKDPRSGRAELARLGWQPEVALFTDAFAGQPKQVEPVLEALGVAASEAMFVGDTDHDRSCAASAGVRFAWAGWNPRVDVVGTDAGSGVGLGRPADLLDLLGVAR